VGIKVKRLPLPLNVMLKALLNLALMNKFFPE